MRVSPYLGFNGNCVEAINFYEKAFGAKAEYCQYKDTPPSEGYQPAPGTEDFVMHGTMKIGDEMIMLADTSPDYPTSFSNGLSICVELENAERVRAVFEGLKEGGKVIMEPQECFWNKCFCHLEDKFGATWLLMIIE